MDRTEQDPTPSDEKMFTSEPLEDDDGNTYVIRQQNVGPGSELGGGEFPDPNTPPSSTPNRRTDQDDEDGLDEAGMQSFPASDPPASNGG